jgi:RNA recognition motif-containing protein
MSKKLYIGGLSYSTTDDGLRDAFSQAGEVISATVMKDKFTGRSRGFGFVEMADEEAMNRAIEMFDGKDLDGRTIKVNEARPLEERPPRSSFKPRFGGGDRGGNGGFRRSYNDNQY